MNLVFIFAVALSVAALTPLALPLLRLAITAVPGRSTTAGAIGESTAAAPLSERELEQSVRNRLYGERSNLVQSIDVGECSGEHPR